MELFIMLLILVLIAIVIATGILYIVTLYNWEEETPSDAPKIKYKSFKIFYNINPNRWDLEDGYVKCVVQTNTYQQTKIIFRFNYMDYIKYKIWILRTEEKEKNIENLQSVAEMLEAVKQDIKNIETVSRQKQDEAIDGLQKIINNMRKQQ